MSPDERMERMRRGHPSAWPQWNPEPIPAAEIHHAWAEALARQGEPGFPDLVRVYTHFAYCKSTCSFCMYWHQVPRSEGDYDAYVTHLVRVLEKLRAPTGPSRVRSAYCGGGTPGATPLPALRRYFEAFRRTFEVAGEFSFEAHPVFFDHDKLALVADSGVKRLSMGVQSLDDDILRSVTRRNRPLDEVERLVRAAQTRGLVVNLDLILGLPGQTAESFRSDVLRLASTGPDILTLYRYQPVIRHPESPPDHMGYARVVTPDLLEQVSKAGYATDRPVDSADICLQLVPKTHHLERSLDGYSLFEDDDPPAHLIGLGSGAYGHLYGLGWFRDVTALSTLSDDDATCTYVGTRLSVEDEIRQAFRSALASGNHTVDLGLLSRRTGVDPRTAFSDVLAFAERHGLARIADDVFQPLPAGDPERRRELLDRLLPTERPPAAGPLPSAVQRELVSLGARSADTSNEALVHAFREALGVPDVGRRWLGAIVRHVDPRSVSFGVELPPRAPLRIHVKPTGTRPTYVDDGHFAISYANDPSGPLTPNERRFLDALCAALKSHR